MILYVIYKITSPSGKVYIGRAKDFDGRMASHKYLSIKGNERPIYRAIRKYGWDNMIKEVIDNAEDLNDAISKELKYIVEFDSVKKGYNATYETEGGGDIWDGLRETERFTEHVEKMRQISLGENNPMYGKTHKQESKDLQKKKAKGRFSLPWFIERYGEVEGKLKYDERCLFLKNRHMPKDEKNRNFIKKQK